MSATVIAFAPRRPAQVAAQAGRNPDYRAWMEAAIRHFRGMEAAQPCPASRPPSPKQAEDEVLKLLRRIDRRLAKMANGGGERETKEAGRGANAA